MNRVFVVYVLMIINWSAVISSVKQMTTKFKVFRLGQVPTGGVRQLAKFTTGSVLECGRLCWNNGNNAGCQGFLYQPLPFPGSNDSQTQSGECELLEFSNAYQLLYEPANTRCPEKFYASVTAAVKASKRDLESNARVQGRKLILFADSLSQTVKRICEKFCGNYDDTASG